MKNYAVIYEESKKIEETFDALYNNNSKETIEKNILALLVELGELANETRCFKYWSIKPASAKNVVLEEYADCLLIILYFCYMVDLKFDEHFDESNEDNVINQFKYLFYLGSKLIPDLDKQLIKKLLVNIINLGKLLSFSDDDIIDGCLLKMKIIRKMFETDY